MTESPDAPARPPSSFSIPWIGLALVLVCALYSLRAQFQQAEHEAGRADAHASARAYFLEHPYLEPGAALSALIAPEELERANAAWAAVRRARGLGGAPLRLREHRQERLDLMLEEAARELGPVPAPAVGVVPAARADAKWLAHPILHRSPWHLIGNALLLLFFGLHLERALGRLGFAATAAGCALAGALAFSVALPGQEHSALVGTSPLLAGLWTVFALRLFAQRGSGFYEVGLMAGALWLGLTPWAELRWSLADVLPFTSGAPAASASVYWSYLGAGAFGAVAASFSAGLAAAFGNPRKAPVQGNRHSLFRRALRSRDAGRPREALEDLEQVLAADPDSLEAATLVWELARELGRRHDATVALIRVIEIQLRRSQIAGAVEHWEALTVRGIPLEAHPKFLLGVSLALRESGRNEAAAFALRCALERAEDKDSRDLAARIARAARGLDPEIVETAAWHALGSIEISLKERQALEGLIAEVLSQKQARPTARPAAAPSPPAPEPIDVESERHLAAVLAVPLGLGDEGLDIQTLEGESKRLRWERIEAISLAAVEGLGTKRVLLLDLVLNWMSTTDEQLRVIRLPSDRFDPRRLAGREGSRVDALRELMETLLERSQATPLPSEEAVMGRPFATYTSLAAYEKAVLLVESDT